MPGLVSKVVWNAINKIERKISGIEAIRAGKRFTLIISNEDMNNITKIIKSLKDLGLLIDWVTETVNLEIKKTRWWISLGFVSTFSRFIISTSNFLKALAYTCQFN